MEVLEKMGWTMFLPFERLTIKSYLGPEEVRQKLSLIVGPRQIHRDGATSRKPYQGELNENSFEISPVIDYRNSFLPVVKGEIRPEIDGTSIHITIRMNAIVEIFMVLLLGFDASMFFLLLCGWLFSVGTFYVSPYVAILIPIGLFIVQYVFSTSLFKLESVKSRSFLEDLFKS